MNDEQIKQLAEESGMIGVDIWWKQEIPRLRKFLELAEVHSGLTLATLCDIALGEDAEDRSDDALIRRVRELVELDKAVKRHAKIRETK